MQKDKTSMQRAAVAAFTLLCVHRLAVIAAPDGGWNSNVPAMFVMGDSLADAGNNNYLPFSVLKSDYFPYGVDFPGRRVATGRFSNSRLVVDILGNGKSFP
jgi:hypothetical protein